MDGELYIVYVDMGQDASERNQKSLAANIQFSENVGAQIVKLQGKTVAEVVAEFVREKHITQVVFGRSATSGLKRYLYLFRYSQISSRRASRGCSHRDSGTSPVTERRRILVVDDEPQITRVLRTSLSSQGYDLRVANDGETALEIMKDWQPDLVITDLSMPNMDGLELCRRLRSTSQIPIIVLSVRGEERTKVKALDAGPTTM